MLRKGETTRFPATDHPAIHSNRTSNTKSSTRNIAVHSTYLNRRNTLAMLQHHLNRNVRISLVPNS
jgi:hypothetical protein